LSEDLSSGRGKETRARRKGGTAYVDASGPTAVPLRRSHAPYGQHLCSLCMSDAEAKTKFKDKGDWCKIHERAQSQCFKCDPSKYERFAAMYRAKYGKEPPKPPQSEFEK